MAQDTTAGTLAELTTLRVGGPARDVATATTRSEAVGTVASADAAGRPVLVLGGGSNVVAGDAGFPGTVLVVATTGREVTGGGDTVRVRAEAGEDWGRLVDFCVEEGLAGIECLAGIPGRVGATPIQNVGAYGQEVSQTVVAVEAWDRRAGETVTLSAAECGFGYRDSEFKRHGGRLILGVTFELERSPLSRPIRYRGLAEALGVDLGARVPLARARDAVVALRRSKGMVIDAEDPDTRSAGSFFTNPTLTTGEFERLEQRARQRLGPGAAVPSFPAGDGRRKVPAAWLIENSGFHRGYQVGSAAISSKHALALTVRSGRSSESLVALARTVRDGVRSQLGVTLVPEPVLVGVEL